MPRFRPTPSWVHDSPEWKAASGFVRTVHRIVRPISGALEVHPKHAGDPPGATFQAKAAELGAHLDADECAEVVKNAVAAGLWRMRGDVLVIPAFPPSAEAKRAVALAAEEDEEG